MSGYKMDVAPNPLAFFLTKDDLPLNSCILELVDLFTYSHTLTFVGANLKGKRFGRTGGDLLRFNDGFMLRFGRERRVPV